MTKGRPLEGIRVLDLTQVYACPTCTGIPSDKGAGNAEVFTKAGYDAEDRRILCERGVA